MCVEAFRPELPVERLDEAILPMAAGSDIGRLRADWGDPIMARSRRAENSLQRVPWKR